MSAHTALSKMGGVAESVIEALRSGTSITDPKLEALRQFTVVINKTRGLPEQRELDAFISAGYTQQNVLEVIVGTSLKVMSNYTNHIAETELDDAFKAVAWSKDNLEQAA